MKHCFDAEVASAVGVHAAVVFENIAFWIEQNRKAGRNEREGVFWTYTTQTSLAEQFPYFTVRQTRSALEKLVETGYLKVGRFNRHGYDQTRWYALAEKGERICRNGQIELTKLSNGKDKNVKPIPDIKTKYIKPNVVDRSRIEHIRRICGIS